MKLGQISTLIINNIAQNYNLSFKFFNVSYCRSVGGFQMMYADSYMTQDEFRAMFDHQLYDR